MFIHLELHPRKKPRDSQEAAVAELRQASTCRRVACNFDSPKVAALAVATCEDSHLFAKPPSTAFAGDSGAIPVLVADAFEAFAALESRIRWLTYPSFCLHGTKLGLDGLDWAEVPTKGGYPTLSLCCKGKKSSNLLLSSPSSCG